MSEVLQLIFKYNASRGEDGNVSIQAPIGGGSMLATLTAVGKTYVDPTDGLTKTQTLAGAPQPEVEADLSSLESEEGGKEQVAAFRAFVAWAEPTMRRRANQAVDDPAAIREEACRVARERQALKAEQESYRVAADKAASEIGMLKQAAEEKRAEMAAAEEARAKQAEDHAQAVAAREAVLKALDDKVAAKQANLKA